MSHVERVGVQPIRNLLCSYTFGHSAKVDVLLSELNPVFEIDRETEEILFWARTGQPNTVGIGMKGSVRLQVQAYAAGIVLTALGTPGYSSMEWTERNQLLEPANPLLNWAVGVDLTEPLKKRGIKLEPGHPLRASQRNVPNQILQALTKEQITWGEDIFRSACVFILLHELAHLKHRHNGATGDSSIEQEKEADRFAAEWMCDAASESSGDTEASRLRALYGISVALLWITVFNVYFGRKECSSHPQGYDRLFQVLDHVIDSGNQDECLIVWDFISRMLFIHMSAAGYEFDDLDSVHMQGHPRDEVSHFIDRISSFDRKKERRI